MAHYPIAQVKVNDDSWVPDYVARVNDIVHKHGGEWLKSRRLRYFSGTGCDQLLSLRHSTPLKTE